MLQNAYFLAKIGADTAENERNFAENSPKIGNYPTGPRLRNRPGGHLPRNKLGSVVGTPDYIAPEVKRALSHRADRGGSEGLGSSPKHDELMNF